ncbi:MAG: Rrf2 family transcriptional regulator [Chloroflexi bacterium]|nr:Rrf2 family transcriptional regulator [Chloroflexota bacterium]MBU1749309.1 Rrf2 family transcriptional regulator [Chloroflexota bacterium]MBU1878358.1 Rrf2 family transcriptional regulator [Chloroflexota bacterium]
MKLSTKTRYGARAMLDLALHYDEEGMVSAGEIADRQDVSLKYLEHLLTMLRSAGLVRSVRGAQGGYTLTRPPAQINLCEIYGAFEGAEGFAECTTNPEICDRTGDCATQEIWAQMHAVCMGLLESISLEDLAQRDRDKQAVSARTG